MYVTYKDGSYAPTTAFETQMRATGLGAHDFVTLLNSADN